MPFLSALGGGARSLLKARGFTAAAVTALALGLGAATAIFSVVDAVLLKAIPFRDPDRLVAIWEKNVALNRADMFAAPANYLEWRRSSSLEDAAAI
jgi:putative ABC transport system permease protein